MQIKTHTGKLHSCGGMMGEILTVDTNAHSYRIAVEISGAITVEPHGGKLTEIAPTVETFEILINRDNTEDLARYLVINLSDTRGALAKYLSPCESKIDGAALFARNLARKAIDSLAQLPTDLPEIGEESEIDRILGALLSL